MGEIEPTRYQWWVFAILILTMCGFVGASLLAHRVANAVNEDAISIATNAAPAIEALSEARGELVRITIAGASVLANEEEVGDFQTATLAPALTALREDLQRYLKQPFYQREDESYQTVAIAVRTVEADANALRAAEISGDHRHAIDILRTGLLPAVGRIDPAISKLVEFNADEVRQLGFAIPLRRRRAHQVGFVLQFLTGILGLALMSLVIRGIRDYARLLARARAATLMRDELLATVSHDLRNPINAITLTMRSIRRASLDAVMEKQAARIERAAERMNRLIDDLLQAAQIEAGGLPVEGKPEEISKLVESAVEIARPIADEKSAHLTSRSSVGADTVPCDSHLILRVLSNIIGNAVKFSPPGGSIVVKTERLPAEAQISVSDDGPGIPAEQKPHVFDRYWHQKKGNRRGTGLGLFIAKGIVEAHGGRIWIESAGRGTTVSFTLPWVRRAAEPVSG